MLADCPGRDCCVRCRQLVWLRVPASRWRSGWGVSLWEGNEWVNNSGRPLLMQGVRAPEANEPPVKPDEWTIHMVFIAIHRFFIPPQSPGTTAPQFFTEKKSSIHSLNEGGHRGVPISGNQCNRVSRAPRPWRGISSSRWPLGVRHQAMPALRISPRLRSQVRLLRTEPSWKLLSSWQR